MKLTILLPLFLFSMTSLFAQQTKVSLNDRWTQMLEHAETYEPYKVIKKVDLDVFWKITTDSVRLYKRALTDEKNKTHQYEHNITTLKKNLDETSTLLHAAEDEKESLTFLGITANKYVYLSVLWIFFLAALVVIAFVFFLYKNSHVVAAEKVRSYDKLTQEFDHYKQAKLDLERKLKRELQTQLNLIEELKKLN